MKIWVLNWALFVYLYVPSKPPCSGKYPKLSVLAGKRKAGKLSKIFGKAKGLILMKNFHLQIFWVQFGDPGFNSNAKRN